MKQVAELHRLAYRGLGELESVKEGGRLTDLHLRRGSAAKGSDDIVVIALLSSNYDFEEDLAALTMVERGAS